ncbi:MAG: class I SAM-dependent methyltransferase [Firmicutes bacterium]|nr:class I SAM-dependent methyltransferase [Bacillota bacterium]
MEKTIKYTTKIIADFVKFEDPKGIIKGKLLKFIPNKFIDLIDLGCGNGRFADYIIENRNVKSILFLDKNPDLIESCKEKYDLTGFEKKYIVGDFKQVQGYGKKVNLIVAGFSIAALFRMNFCELEYNQIICILTNKLKDEGSLILVEYAGFCFENGEQAVFAKGDSGLETFIKRLRKDSRFRYRNFYSEICYPTKKEYVKKYLLYHWLPSFEDIIEPRLVEYKDNNNFYTKLPVKYFMAVYEKNKNQDNSDMWKS